MIGALRAVALVMVVVIATGASAGEPLIKVASASPADAVTSGTYVWLQAFMKSLERAGFAASFYPSATLGGETERFEQTAIGLLEINDTNSQEVGQASPLMSALDLPFLFEDYAHLDRLLDRTPFLAEVNARATVQGIRVLDVVAFGGMAGLFTTQRAVNTPDHLRGLRLRARDRSQLRQMSAWGANATQVAWEEVSQALQTGVVDGYLNPPLIPLIYGHTRQIRYFIDLAVAPSTRVIIASEDWYSGLTASEQQAVDRAVSVAHRANRTWLIEATRQEAQRLRAAGIQQLRPGGPERARFAARSAPLYENIVPASFLVQLRRWVEEVR